MSRAYDMVIKGGLVVTGRKIEVVDTIKQFKENGIKKSCLDFAIHGALFDPENQSKEIPKAFGLGVTSFKMFMAYAKLKWMG